MSEVSHAAGADLASRPFLYVPGSVPLPPAEEIGGKGHHLARLAGLAAAHGFTVPRFVVLRVAAFTTFTPPRGTGGDRKSVV